MDEDDPFGSERIQLARDEREVWLEHTTRQSNEDRERYSE